LKARIGFRLGSDSFVAQIADGTFTSGRGDIEGAHATFTGAPAALAAAVYGGQPLEALEAAGALEVKGDRALAKRFTTLFPLPPKVGAAS